MPYFPNTEADRRAMLEAIGAATVDELFAMIPAELRMKRGLSVEPGLGELELTTHLTDLAGKNTHAGQAACFLGGGSYDHFIPSVVDAVSSRGEFYTAYTPYQAEASQGSLQAFFEYQTLVAQLTGMDVSNASMYDCGSAATEAVLMAMHSTGRKRVVAARSVHPEYIEVLKTYLANMDVELVVLDATDGAVAVDRLADAVDDQTACVLVQHPNFFGCLEDVERATQIAHDAGALMIVAVDPISLGLLKRPGDYGADIVVAEGQSLGNPMGFGGPYLGIMACREKIPSPHARPAGRPDRRSAWKPLLGADDADPRAAHPPRKGHQQHLHQPRFMRASGDGLSIADGTVGHEADRRALPAKGPLRRRAAGRRAVDFLAVRSADVQGVRRPRRRPAGRKPD